MSFAQAEIKKSAQLICLGHVTGVEDAHESSSGQNYTMKITIENIQGGRNANATPYFSFRPEWIGFTPEDVKALRESDSKAYFTYLMNVVGQPTTEDREFRPSLLQSLCGYNRQTDDKTAFLELATRIQALGVDAIAQNPTLVSDTLRQFLVEERGDVTIGYQLRNQMKDTGEKTADGKKIKVPTKWMEVASFFNPTEKNIAAKRKLAESKPDLYKMYFTESEVPF